MSWHRGDWLAFAQAAASTAAVVVAVGIVFVQDWMQSRAAKKDRLRDRYRCSTYAAALIQNAIDCAVPVLEDVETVAKRAAVNGDFTFDASRMDKASDALCQSLHTGLPTEITDAVLSAWLAAQQLCHALHRADEVRILNMQLLLAHCREQYSVLNSSMEVVRHSKAKWEAQLRAD
ncbi:hypothetical protein [Burkholderia multivorans]|uniref:hypothetical protein n=1 Tax=Burkholderia multivorans TaxID=87883 RepID=UPI0021C00561|nr:hypothetical protein [Burkholderia multivorans]